MVVLLLVNQIYAASNAFSNANIQRCTGFQRLLYMLFQKVTTVLYRVYLPWQHSSTKEAHGNHDVSRLHCIISEDTKNVKQNLLQIDNVLL